MYNYSQLPGFMTPERWQQIERLYQEALKCEPRERAGLLALTDPELRDEVERLLEQSVGTPNLILGGAGTQTGQYAIDDARGDVMNPAAGQQIGNYLLQEQLGAGGMGIVFRAEDLKLRRSVALKFLPPHLTSDPRQRAQLLREARAASKLDHVNIGTIHSIEEADGGQIFIVMACYEGETLKSRIGRGPIIGAEVEDIVVQIAEGLREAHSNGVVHRDIKPSNLILTRQGVVKIIDFGLARLAEPETQTRSGTVAGTAAYMSPEQAQGKPADQRCDLWALGVVLYEMLSGRLPFHGDSIPGLLYAIVHQPPEPTGQLSGLWSSIVDRALAKDPACRYQNAAEFLAAIEGRKGFILAETETIVQPAQATEQRVNKPFKRKWAAMAATGMLAAAGIGLYFTRGYGPLAEAGPKHLAVLPFLNIGDDPANRLTSDGLLETLTSRLSDLDSSGKTLWVVPASEVRQRKVTEPRDAVKQLGVNFVVTGSVQREKKGVRLTVNLVDPRNLRQIGSAVISESEGNYAALEEGAVVKLAELLRVDAETASSAQHARADPAAYEQYLEAMGYLHRWDQQGNLEKAIALFEKVGRDDPKFHLGLAGLSEAYRLRYTLDHNQKWVDLALRAANRALEADSKLEPVYVTLGRVHNSTGQYEVAMEEFERALGLAPSDADAIQGMAQTYQKLGRNREAESMFRRGTALRPDSWEGYLRLGNFYYTLRRFPEAESQYRRVLELAPDNAPAYINLGTALTNENRYGEARTVLEKAVALNPTYSAYNNLASVYYLEGRDADAAAIYEKARRLNNADYLVWGNLAAAYAAAPALANQSQAAFEKAALLAEQKAREAPDAAVEADLGSYYARLKMPDKARVRLESALALAPEDSTVVLTVAEGYAILGDRAAAQVQLRKALALGSSLEYAKRLPALQDIAQEQSVQSFK
jgi:eukaryotic-like serine/threonine-protein kinase